jgi:hypothetical protein
MKINFIILIYYFYYLFKEKLKNRKEMFLEDFE